MTEELQSSPKFLQKKFQMWFSDPVPADPSFPTKADSKRDFVATDLSFLADAYHLFYQSRRRSRYDLPKLLELISFGFIGAFLLGASVGFILLLMNIGLRGWYGKDWPEQFVVIFLAMVIGFGSGMFKRSLDMVRENYTFKDKL